MLKTFLALVCIGALLWFGVPPLRSLLSGAEPTPSNDPAGEWVGRLDLQGGYVPSLMGETSGSHTQAAIRFRLEITDRFLGRYGGNGEMCILGEARPRSIRIANYTPDANGRGTVKLLTDPLLTDITIDAQVTGKRFTLIQKYDEGLKFQGILERGTDADYRALCSQPKGNPQ